MIAFQNVGEILEKSLAWEQKLKDLYDVAEVATRREESGKIVTILRDNLARKLEVLRNIDQKKFGTLEWVRYAADFQESDLLAAESLHRESTPEEILGHIVRYEQHLRDFYAHIAEHLVSRDQKELFESLVAFKAEQIEEFGRIASLTK